MTSRAQQQGAAILMAMVTVTLVAAVAAAAVHRQWSRVEVEQAERSRVQALWLLRGAMDWSRLLLRQDAQSAASVDHLAEPWAIPLQETKLSSFVQAQAGVSQNDASSDSSEAYLSGMMQDLQARINVLQVLSTTAADGSVATTNAVERLFDRLGLPHSEYVRLQQGLRQASNTADAHAGQRPIMPQRLDDLAWLGVSAQTIKALAPYAMLWESTTKVNLNTASAVVIWAAAPELDWGQAQALVQARAQQHFKTLADAQQKVAAVTLSEDIFTVQSSLFEASGQIRMDGIVLTMQSDLERNNTRVQARSARTMGMALQVPQTHKP